MGIQKSFQSWQDWGYILINALPGNIYYNPKSKIYDSIPDKNSRKLKTYEVFLITKQHINKLKENFENKPLREKICEWQNFEKSNLKKKFILIKLTILFFQRCQNLYFHLGFKSNYSIAQSLLNQIPEKKIAIHKKSEFSNSHKNKTSKLPIQLTKSDKIEQPLKQALIEPEAKKEILPWKDRLKEIFEKLEVGEIKLFFKYILNESFQSNLTKEKRLQLKEEWKIALGLMGNLDREKFRKLVIENAFCFSLDHSPYQINIDPNRENRKPYTLSEFLYSRKLMNYKGEEACLLAELFTSKFYYYHEEIFINLLSESPQNFQFLLYCMRVFHETTYRPNEIDNGLYHEISTFELFIMELIKQETYLPFINYLKSVQKDEFSNSPIYAAMSVFLSACVIGTFSYHKEKKDFVLNPLLELLDSMPVLKKEIHSENKLIQDLFKEYPKLKETFLKNRDFSL